MAVTIGRVRQQNQLQGRLNASRRAKALALAEGQRVDLGALRQYRNTDLTLEDAAFLDAAATESIGSELFASFLQSIRDGVEEDG